jgi:kynurenine formamidase
MEVAGEGKRSAKSQRPEKGPWWPSPWGADDQLGALNHLGPQTVLAAASHIRTGEIIDLALPFRSRYPDYHSRDYILTSAGAPAIGPVGDGRWVANDETISGQFTGMSTHFNALIHVGQQLGEDGNTNTIHYYNGFTQAEIGSPWGFKKLGIENVKPILTSGILIDLAASLGGRPADGYVFTVDDFCNALARQDMSEQDIQRGDAVFWTVGNADRWFTNPQAYINGTPGFGIEVAAWLASKEVSIVGMDSFTAEPFPRNKNDVCDVHGEFLCHQGIYMIINLNLSELAKRGVYRFALSCTPIPFVGAQGSPVRPFAII